MGQNQGSYGSATTNSSYRTSGKRKDAPIDLTDEAEPPKQKLRTLPPAPSAPSTPSTTLLPCGCEPKPTWSLSSMGGQTVRSTSGCAGSILFISIEPQQSYDWYFSTGEHYQVKNDSRESAMVQAYVWERKFQMDSQPPVLECREIQKIKQRPGLVRRLCLEILFPKSVCPEATSNKLTSLINQYGGLEPP